VAKFVLTKKAVDDLSSIWKFTCRNWSEKQADKYYKVLSRSFAAIAESPECGNTYFKVIDGLRGFKVGRHIVFFRQIEGGNIQIIRILHEQMDLKNRLNEE